MNPGMARFLAKKFLEEVIADLRPERLHYPV